MGRVRHVWMLVAILIVCGSVYADSWIFPEERYCSAVSENKRFAVYLTPANKKVVALLEVVEIKGQDERLVWKSEWKGRLLPLEVYVANDGGNVVTVNEMGRAGYGDHVLCFFNSSGLIKNYSMVEILHLPKNTDDFDLMELVPHSMTSRLWDEHSTKVLDRNSGRLHFCIWLGLFKRWVAWDATNGKEVKPDDKMTGRWNAKARLLSIKRAMEGSYGWTPDEEEAPFMFLAWLKRPEDRKVVEQLLSDKQFHTSRYSGAEFRYAQLSSKRAFAERLLAEWDGKPTESADPSGFGRPIYYYLGVIEGQVKLPEVPKIGDGVLWIFLVPNKVEKSRCPKDPPIHRLAVTFDKYYLGKYGPKPSEHFGFTIEGITPGKYWVKVVWDKAEPYYDQYAGIGRPKQGDYESVDLPVVTIEAGRIVKHVIIDCTHGVGDGRN